MRLEKASYRAVSYACINYHYAKSVPTVAMAYSVFDRKGVFCGVIVYGHGATPNMIRPYDKWHGQVLELVRVALNGKQEKTSKAVAISLKMLKKDAPLVDLIVSYADVDQQHVGTIYQATNWIYTGLQNEGSRGAFIVHGKKVHPRSIGAKGWVQSLEWLRLNIDPDADEHITEGKYKYLYPLNDATKKQVEVLKRNYPNMRPKQATSPVQGDSGGAAPTRTLQNKRS